MLEPDTQSEMTRRPWTRGGRSLRMAVVMAAAAYACGDGATAPDSDPASAYLLSSPTVEGLVSGAPIRICGAPGVGDLLDARGLSQGTATVSNDGRDLTVLIQTVDDWEIEAAQLSVSGSVATIPLTGTGRPQVGRFPYRANPVGGTTRYAFSVSLTELDAGTGDELTVSLHVDLLERNDPAVIEDDRREGVWRDGTLFDADSNGNAGRYSSYVVQACTAVTQTIGVEGGTVEVEGVSPGERASLVIPPGALQGPVGITIKAIPLSDVPLPTPVPPGLQNLVEGTAYDFGPDGLAFELPAFLTIAYNEDQLGGKPESAIALFRVDEGAARVASLVDEATNEVSAFVDHFTIYVVATDDGIAAMLQELVGVSEEVTITVRPASRPSAAENVAVTDEVTINVLTTRRSVVDESVGITDLVTINVRSLPRSRVAEGVGIADQVSINVVSPIRSAVSEAVGVTEAISVRVTPAERPAKNFVYIALQGADSVAVLDPETNTLVGRIPVGRFPYAVEAHPTEPEVYVTNRGDGSVSVIDTETQSVVATIPNVVNDPIDIAVSGDGLRAYVVDNDSPLIGVIDLSTRTVGSPLMGSTRLARSVVLSRPGDVAYVAGVDSLVVFDLTSATADTIPGTFSPGDMALTDDGLDLWMTDTADGEVLIFDGATAAFEATVSGLSAPQGIGMSPTTAWVAAAPASLMPIDVALRTVGTPVALAFDADWIAVAGITLTTAYVSEGRGGTRIAVVDLATGTVLTTLAIGSSPAGLAVTEW